MSRNPEAQIWNLHNCLIHYANQKDVAGILDTFSGDKIRLELPDQKLQLKGIDEVSRFLEHWAQGQSTDVIHLVNSPSIQVNGDSAKTSCMTASFELRTAHENTCVTHFASRLDISYSCYDGQWKISEICWYDYAALMPWAIQAADAAPFQQCIKSNLKKSAIARITQENENYTAISNCAGKEMYLRMSQNRDFVMLFTPVIFGDGDSGEGYWNGLHFSPLDGEKLAVSVILVHELFEKCQEKWHCIKSETDDLLTLPEMELTPFAPPPAKMMAEKNRRRSLPPEQPGQPELREYFNIANTAAMWTSAIRTCNPTGFYEQCLAKDHPNLYVDVIKRTEGLAGFFQECETMVRMDKTQAKKPGNHTLTTPWIEISEDGTAATASFLDFGWTLMAEAFGNTDVPYPAMPNIGRYEHHLIKEDGIWKVWGFNWGPLYQNGGWSYDPEATRGWSGTKSKYRWPEVLEAYHYREDFDGVDEFASNPITLYMGKPEPLDSEPYGNGEKSFERGGKKPCL